MKDEAELIDDGNTSPMATYTVKNYIQLKNVLIEVIRYLNTDAFLKDNLCYTKEDIEKYLKDVVKDAMQEYFK